MATGHVQGTKVKNNVLRLTLPFAKPPVGFLRFANPQLVRPEVLFHNDSLFDATKTPSACYQASPNPNGGNPSSEDCLYTTFYLPPTAKAGDKLPIIVWTHGGSGIVGSSTQAGLDGSTLASSQNVIVAFVQYRLGLFGWLQTTSTLDEERGGESAAEKVAGNQALRDVVTALEHIRLVAPAFGGDSDKITLMGQSSGAQLVRSLLTTPSALSLFSRAILVSDTQNYGPSTVRQNNFLGELAMKKLNCSLEGISCARSKTAGEILDVSLETYREGPIQDSTISGGTPWRPMVGSFMTSAMEKDAIVKNSPISKPTIFTTVQNEAGTVASVYFSPTRANEAELVHVDNSSETTTLAGALNSIFNDGRGALSVNGSAYTAHTAVTDGLRSDFERISTDGLWRCANQYNVKNLAKIGSEVWLAEWKVGYTAMENEGRDYCKKEEIVCHEDDIYLIFGTMPSTPTTAQKTLSSEIQERFAAFARGQDPNTENAIDWPKVDKDGINLNLLTLGKGKDEDGISTLSPSQSPDTCAATSNMWGQHVKFDWQLYS